MKLRATTINHILCFLRARHLSDMRESTKHQSWLKKKLKDDFTTVLLKHGDPDRDGYMDVMQKWFEEERQAVRKQEATGR